MKCTRTVIELSLFLWFAAFAAHAQQDNTVIQGLVRDALTGQAIPGAYLRIRTLRVETTSDALGRYMLPAPAGRHTVELEPPDGYAILKTVNRKDVLVEAGQRSSLDWSVSRALSISGFTLDAGGRPLGQMPFKVLIGNGGILEGESDRDGRFWVIGVPPNTTVSFESQHQRLITDRFDRFDVGVGNAENLLVSFFEAARISGVVETENGKAVADAELAWEFTRSESRGRVSGGTRTDARGRFVMEDVQFGQYDFTIKPSDGRSQKLLSLKVAPGERVDKLRLVYRPEAGLTIRGRIVDADGNGIPNAEITAGDTGFTFSFMSHTDAEGRFTLHDLKEGVQYGIGYVHYRGNQYQVMKRLATGAQDVTLRIELEPPADIEQFIEGQVVDAASGEPIPQFDVAFSRGIADVVSPDNPRIVGFMHRGINETIRDPNGRFRLRVYRSEEYTVWIRAKTYGQWIGLLRAPSTDARIALEPESRIRGVVADAAGTPIADALLLYHSKYGEQMPETSEIGYLGRTGSDGSFDIGGLSAGEHPIAVVHPDYPDFTLRATAVRGGGDLLNLTMPTGGVLTGTVYVNDLPHTPAWINVTHTEHPAGYSLSNESNAAGRYRIGRLSSGVYTVYIAYELPNGKRPKPERRTTTIVAGEETVLDIRIYTVE